MFKEWSLSEHPLVRVRQTAQTFAGHPSAGPTATFEQRTDPAGPGGRAVRKVIRGSHGRTATHIMTPLLETQKLRNNIIQKDAAPKVDQTVHEFHVSILRESQIF